MNRLPMVPDRSRIVQVMTPVADIRGGEVEIAD